MRLKKEDPALEILKISKVIMEGFKITLMFIRETDKIAKGLLVKEKSLKKLFPTGQHFFAIHAKIKQLFD